jgi:hypothetical protein
MKKARVNIVFPKSRSPQRIFLEENNRRRTTALNENYWKKLTDGRWQVTWEVDKPRLYENYVVRWVW